MIAKHPLTAIVLLAGAGALFELELAVGLGVGAALVVMLARRTGAEGQRELPAPLGRLAKSLRRALRVPLSGGPEQPRA